MDQNRPKTRGLEASEAEEDAKAIKAALKEPDKVNFKRIQQKLKSDYGGGKAESDSDDEDKLFYNQPPYEEEDVEGKPGYKRRRFGGARRNAAKRKFPEEEVRRAPARLTAALKGDLKPKIVPYDKSSVEYKQVRYKLGDFVSLLKEGDERTYYAQILGFHTDQFCERYATIRWLIPAWDDDVGDANVQDISVESFRTCVDEDEPVHMACLQFVLRPPAWYYKDGNPNIILERSGYIYKNKLVYLDTPSSTLTSADKRY